MIAPFLLICYTCGEPIDPDHCYMVPMLRAIDSNGFGPLAFVHEASHVTWDFSQLTLRNGPEEAQTDESVFSESRSEREGSPPSPHSPESPRHDSSGSTQS